MSKIKIEEVALEAGANVKDALENGKRAWIQSKSKK